MGNENKILELPIEKLSLSLRSYFCLKNFSIDTIEDLVNVKISDLYRVRNLGPKCYDEIINKVHELGLCFAGEKEENKEKRI